MVAAPSHARRMYQLVPAGDSSKTDSPKVIRLLSGLTDLGRENLGQLGDKVLATIHRSHAQVLLEGSSVRLTSLGSNPTGVRCRGTTEWRWLAKGEAVELADGTELAFSKSKQLRTQSTFVLRHAPRAGSIARTPKRRWGLAPRPLPCFHPPPAPPPTLSHRTTGVGRSCIQGRPSRHRSKSMSRPGRRPAPRPARAHLPSCPSLPTLLAASQGESGKREGRCLSGRRRTCRRGRCWSAAGLLPTSEALHHLHLSSRRPATPPWQPPRASPSPSPPPLPGRAVAASRCQRPRTPPAQTAAAARLLVVERE